jgi:hypothetical protein
MVAESKWMKSWKFELDNYFKNSSDIFFQEEYHRAFCLNQQDSTPEAFFYKKGEAVFLFPLIKRKILDGPFFDFETVYGYSGPLSSTDDPVFLSEANAEFRVKCRQSQIVAGFIRYNPFVGNVDKTPTLNTFNDRDIVVMDLSLSSEEILTKSIHQKHRNAINKSIKLGSQFVEDKELEQFNTFKQLYARTMFRLQVDSFFLFDDRFFEYLKINLKKNLLLFAVQQGDKTVAACLVLTYGRVAHYFLSASDEDSWNVNPNTLLIYRSALALKSMGFEKFNLGGGRTGNDDSLFKFKKRFSNTAYPFSTGKIIINDEIYEQLVAAWEAKSSNDVREKYRHFLLKYRN